MPKRCLTFPKTLFANAAAKGSVTVIVWELLALVDVVRASANATNSSQQRSIIYERRRRSV